MNRKIMFITGFLIMVIALKSYAQRIDSTAVYLLNRTAETFQDIKACSFTTVTNYDIPNANFGLIKHAVNDKLTIKFPDKMKVTSSGDKGNRALLYNGKKLHYYSFDNNTYAITSAPNSVIETIDEVSNKFGIEFPGADFFYPTFVNDLITANGSLVFFRKNNFRRS